MNILSSNMSNKANSQQLTANSCLPKTYLQYISQGNSINEHLENIKKVCEAGGKWVQLRLKNIALIDYLKAAKEARIICDANEAVLIINDKIGIAGESGADGVHLGLEDTKACEARKQLGSEAIIGGTANTFEDCLYQINNGVDYLGIGPYAFTQTKKKLSPILGAKGFKTIVRNLIENGHELPVVGIGGIALENVPEIAKSELSNIAVSGMLTGIPMVEIKKKIEKIEQAFS